MGPCQKPLLPSLPALNKPSQDRNLWCASLLTASEGLYKERPPLNKELASDVDLLCNLDPVFFFFLLWISGSLSVKGSIGLSHGQQIHIIYSSSQLIVCLKSATVGMFTPRKLVNATNQDTASHP